MNSRQGLERVNSQRASNSQQRKNAYIIDKFILPFNKTETSFETRTPATFTPSPKETYFPRHYFPIFSVGFCLGWIWMINITARMNQRATHFNLGSSSAAYGSTYLKDYNPKQADAN
jgi:hypothetical protein